MQTFDNMLFDNFVDTQPEINVDRIADKLLKRMPELSMFFHPLDEPARSLWRARARLIGVKATATQMREGGMPVQMAVKILCA